MTLKYDPEMQRVLSEATDKANREDHKALWSNLLFVGFVLAATIATLHYLDADTGLMVSVTIAVAACCVIAALGAALVSLNTNIVMASGYIEWFGTKWLGEVEETQGELT